MVNRATLIGYLGHDPDLRYTQSGQPVANFSMATSERWKDQSGDTQERTEWHRIVVWGRSAEFCGNYLAKGRLVYVEGRLQTREWEDRDGIKRRTTEVVAMRVQALGSRSDRNAPPHPAEQEDPERETDRGNYKDQGDDSIPF